MRILCVHLQTSLDPNPSITLETNCAEAFLRFSPRVQFRFPHYIFADIESTSHLLGGEFQILKDAVEIARKISPHATAAIANTASLAQALVHFRPFEISKQFEESDLIRSLPISILSELEGLVAWEKPKQIEQVISFFQSVGIHSLQDIFEFSLSSFRERWGDTGVTIWKRLHGRDLQIISPLQSHEPLAGYAYFDDPIGSIPQLMEHLDPQIEFLFLRLEGIGRFAQQLQITLHCEYSEKRHKLIIEPVSPNRDRKLFTDLLLQKLESLDFENPIREVEIFIFDVPEKIQQLDFFEPRDPSEDRWRKLISFAKQAQCEMGFLQIEGSLFPEDSYSIQTDWPKEFSSHDLVDKIVEQGSSSESNSAIQIKSVYAKALAKSPRPSLLLKNPLHLPKALQSKLRFLTKLPAERIESSWWSGVFKSLPFTQRDYYFALSNEGQLLWVFQDRSTKAYFLHGYFD